MDKPFLILIDDNCARCQKGYMDQEARENQTYYDMIFCTDPQADFWSETFILMPSKDENDCVVLGTVLIGKIDHLNILLTETVIFIHLEDTAATKFLNEFFVELGCMVIAYCPEPGF